MKNSFNRTNSPPCSHCWNLTSSDSEGQGWQCKAFPNGIPQAILKRIRAHKKSWGKAHQTGRAKYRSVLYSDENGLYSVTYEGEVVRLIGGYYE